jgi:hypothetical protein
MRYIGKGFIGLAFSLFIAGCAAGDDAPTPDTSDDELSSEPAAITGEEALTDAARLGYAVAPSTKASVVSDAAGDTVEIDLFVNGVSVSGWAGYARLTTNSTSSHHLTVCAFGVSTGTYAGTVYADVDPGSGVLQEYSNAVTGPCTEVNLGAVRKFRAWYWIAAPGAGGRTEIDLGIGRNTEIGIGDFVGSATIGYPNGSPVIHVRAVPGDYAGTVYADIDPGNGQLKEYSASNGATDNNPGTSLRKFRGWYWAAP